VVDIATLRQTAGELRAYAQQIRRENEVAQHPTAAEDAGLFERAAKGLEDSAAEIERLQSPQSK
jgi:hypothetical protein